MADQLWVDRSAMVSDYLILENAKVVARSRHPLNLYPVRILNMIPFSSEVIDPTS